MNKKKFKKRETRTLIEIRLEITTGLQSFTATSRNLSLGGVSFESLERFSIGEKINILLYMPIKKDLELLRIASKVIWVKFEQTEGLWLIGTVFQKFAPGDQRRLKEWLIIFLKYIK